MSTAGAFRVNSPSVAWEDFDDETVIVNLESGQYFSTRAVGSEIWRRLAKGAPLPAVEQALIALYDTDAALAAQALSDFVGALQQHGLLLPNDTSEDSAWQTEPCAAVRRAFLAPVLETYSDMQDLLLLDPIHDVDESGWPNPR